MPREPGSKQDLCANMQGFQSARRRALRCQGLRASVSAMNAVSTNFSMVTLMPADGHLLLTVFSCRGWLPCIGATAGKRGA